MDKRRKYFWQGEPVKVEFGQCFVKRNDDKPLTWYNFECHINLSDGTLQPTGTGTGAIIDAIKVTAKDGESFVIANHFGIGAYKLKKGGWPDCTHFSLPIDKFENVPWRDNIQQRNLDVEKYSEHEAARNKWLKKNYPKEYEKIEGLRKIIRKQNYGRKHT